MNERILSIQLRLTENTAANNRVLQELERRVKSAVNPSASNTSATRLVPPALALQVVAATQAQAQIRVVQERLNADLERLRARDQSNAVRHERRMEEIALQGARRRAAAQPSILGRLTSPNVREAGESLQQSGQAFDQYLTRPLLGISKAAVQSALDIDVFRTRLVALEGSTDAANKRLESLRKFALTAPGVTFQAAADQYTLLKGTTDLLPASIERVIGSVGKLNAAFKLDSAPLFIRNLQQIFTQNFEIKDIREALGRVPVFNQLLERAFGTSDPEQLRKLKAAGKITSETYFRALADAINSDPRIGNVQESLAARFEKLSSRVEAALEPLGTAVLNILGPVVERAVPLVEGLGSAFAALPVPIQLTVVALGALTAAIGPTFQLIGGLVQSLQLFQLSKTVSDIATLTGGISGAAKAATAAEAAAVASAAGWARFGAGITSAGAAATTAATATKAAATGFSLLNPWVLGIGALLLIAAASTNSYASELDKATQINTTHVARLTEQQKTYQTNLATLKDVAKAQGDTNSVSEKLNQTLSSLDPATRNYANGLTTVEQKASAVAQQLERLKGANDAVLRAQQRTLIQGALEATQKLSDLTGEIVTLSEAQRQYAADVDAVRAQSTAVLGPLTDYGDLLARTDAQVEQNSKQTEEYRQKLLNVIPNLVDVTQSLGGNTEGLLAQLKAGARNQAQIQVLNEVFAPYIRKQQDAATAANQHTVSLLNQADASKALQDAMNALNIQQNPKLAALVVQAAKTGKNAGELIAQQVKNDAELRQGIADGQAVRKALDQANEFLNPSKGKKSGLVAVSETTAQAVAKLRAEVTALEAGGGKLFDLEIDRERLGNTKSQLLEILKLRRELGVRQGEKLPSTQDARESELRLLGLDKRTREDIVRLAEQQAEFEARIAVERARASSDLPTGEQRAQLALEEEGNKLREDRLELDARWLLLQNRVFNARRLTAQAEKQAVEAVPLEARERIVAAEKELGIIQAVARARQNDANRALDEQALLAEARAQTVKDEEAANREIGRLNAQIFAGLIDQETAVALFRAQNTLSRLQDEQRTIAAIRDAEEQLLELRAGVGVDKVVNRAKEARLQAEKQTLQELLALREEDRTNFTQTEDYKRGILERAELARRQSARQTTDEILLLQEEIAHAAEGAAQRYELAYLRAIRNIQQEDEAANVRLLENQIKLARQTEVRYDRLNDRVIDLLASQKGLTEAFQDFRANSVQGTFDLIDKAVDKITKRFGVLGDAVKQLLKDLLRLAATKVFEKVLNLNSQQAPQSASGFSIPGLLQSGAPSGGGFNLGGFNLGGGIGPGGTGTFTGAPVNLGGGGTSAGGGSSVGGFRGLINRVAGFNLFNARAASAITAPFPTGTGALPTITAAQAGIPTTLSTETALARAAGIKAGAGSAFGALGATGLLAGGGLLGSLAGGQSQTGRLLGGLGGTLGAGFIGASGLLGGSAAAGTGIAGGFGALAPLLSNPITAVVAGALVGTALIVRAFANRDLKKLAATIKDVHQVNVPVKGEGLALLKQIKEIGQAQYGKRWLDQRADLVRQQSVVDILTQYAVGTGQNGSSLARNKRLTDPFNEANNFVRRVNGGPIPGLTLGRDYIPALLDGNEYVSAARTVQREGLGRFAALEAGLATITPKSGSNGAEIAALRAEMGAMFEQMAAALAPIAPELARLRVASARDVLAFGLDQDPGLLPEALSRAQTSGNLYSFTDKLNQ